MILHTTKLALNVRNKIRPVAKDESAPALITVAKKRYSQHALLLTARIGTRKKRYEVQLFEATHGALL